MITKDVLQKTVLFQIALQTSSRLMLNAILNSFSLEGDYIYIDSKVCWGKKLKMHIMFYEPEAVVGMVFLPSFRL